MLIICLHQLKVGLKLVLYSNQEFNLLLGIILILGVFRLEDCNKHLPNANLLPV